jgi:hypothetical protein
MFCKIARVDGVCYTTRNHGLFTRKNSQYFFALVFLPPPCSISEQSGQVMLNLFILTCVFFTIVLSIVYVFKNIVNFKK